MGNISAKIRILGYEYAITGEGSISRVEKVRDYVQGSIDKLAGARLSNEQRAVLAALRAADDLMAAREMKGAIVPPPVPIAPSQAPAQDQAPAPVEPSQTPAPAASNRANYSRVEELKTQLDAANQRADALAAQLDEATKRADEAEKKVVKLKEQVRTLDAQKRRMEWARK